MYLNFNKYELDEMLSSQKFCDFMTKEIMKLSKINGDFLRINYFIDEENDNEVHGIAFFNKNHGSKNILGRYFTLDKRKGYIKFQRLKKAQDINEQDKSTPIRSEDYFVFL